MGGKAHSVNIEDRDLRTLFDLKGYGVTAGDKDSVVGIAAHIGTPIEVLGKQGDVSEGVVLALSRSGNDGYASLTLTEQELDSLSLVVGLLVGVVADNIGKAGAVGTAYRVAVANDYVGYRAVVYKGISTAVTTDRIGAIAHYIKYLARCRVAAVGYNYRVYNSFFQHTIIFFQLRYPNRAITA